MVDDFSAYCEPSEPQSLQAIVLSGLLRNLPEYCRSGTWPLPNVTVSNFFYKALALYSVGSNPALPVQKVFAALRSSDFPSFRLICNEDQPAIPEPARHVLAVLAPEQVADMISSFLLARSEVVYVEDIAVSTSQISSKRAFERFLRLVGSSCKTRALGSLAICGVASRSSTAWQPSGQDLGAIARELSGNLSFLKLSGLDHLDDTALATFLRSTSAGLETLNASMSSVKSMSCILSESFGFRSTLRVLDMSATGVGGNLDDILCLMGLAALEELSLGWTPAVRPDSVDAGRDTEVADMLGTVVARSSMPNLVQLDLSGATLPLERVVAEASGVRRLCIASAKFNDVDDDRLFAHSLPRGLEKLDMSFCHGIASIASIVDTATGRTGNSLKHLRLVGCELPGWDPLSLIRDESASAPPSVAQIASGEAFPALRRAFGPNSPNLQELDLSVVGRLTAISLCAVLTSRGLGNSLEVLRMRHLRVPALAECFSGVYQLSTFPIVFPELKRLDISDSELSLSNDAPGASSGASLGWFVEVLLSGGRCTHFSAAGTKHMNYGVVTLMLEKSYETLEYLDISFLPFPQQHVLAGGQYAVMPPTSEFFPKLRQVKAFGCGQLPQAMVDLLQSQAPLFEEVQPADELVAKDNAGERLGRSARRQAYATELVRLAEEREKAELSKLSWRKRP